MPFTGERRRRYNREWRERCVEIILEAKRKPCTDCWRIFPHYVMQFDHMPGAKKSFKLALAKAVVKNEQRLREEIAKCELVCANCHAIRTWKRKPWRTEGSAMVRTSLEN